MSLRTTRARRLEDRFQATPLGEAGRAYRGRGPDRGPLVTPFRFALAAALVGSIAFVAYAATIRDSSQIPMLTTSALVLGLTLGVVAGAAGVATYRAGRDGAGALAFAFAIAGGIAAIAAALSLAGAVILAMVWSGG
ncbi:MAG TPA: hypothetical protein VNJ28_02175 [Candidatus Limnocylindrales bacterium]|nr:hypothetical protein [Candidatus Limnocylindrales bacterium]